MQQLVPVNVGEEGVGLELFSIMGSSQTVPWVSVKKLVMSVVFFNANRRAGPNLHP